MTRSGHRAEAGGTTRAASNTLVCQSLTAGRWADLVKLFGPRGACAGCWCMWFRLPRAEFDRLRGDGTRRRLNALARSPLPPGLIAYRGDEPVGWCAVAPRAAYPRLARSRVLAPVDDQPVWSVTCFFVARGARGQGVTRTLLAAAAAFAARHGATVLEGYPVEPRVRQPDTFVYHGLLSAFTRTGFREVARRSPSRPIVRRALKPEPTRRRTTGISRAGAPSTARARRATATAHARPTARRSRGRRG